MRVIDADGHVTEPQEAWLDHLPPEMHVHAPRRVTDNQGRVRTLLGGELQPYIPLPEGPRADRPTGGADPVARLADMDSEGIDVAVLFPTTGLQLVGITDLAVSIALCGAYNDWLTDYRSTDPARLVGVGVVSQLDPGAALAEATRCIDELGCRGIMMRPNKVNGRSLDDPAWDPLWTLLADRRVPACMHEGTTQNVAQSGLDRFENFMFRHACSHPHEQQMAVLELICGGVLERHPTLEVVFLESGCGWLPHWLSRLDGHIDEWGYASLSLPLLPSQYWARQCFISADPDEAILPGVVDVLGADTIVFATDYPHPDGIWPGVVDALAGRDDLDADAKSKILATNAEKLFGLTPA